MLFTEGAGSPSSASMVEFWWFQEFERGAEVFSDQNDER